VLKSATLLLAALVAGIVVLTAVSGAFRPQEAGLVGRWILTIVALVLLLGITGLIGMQLRRRQAELREHLHSMRRQAHLREQTERIINSVPVGIVAIGAEHRVVSINRFMVERFAAVEAGSSIEVAFPTAAGAGGEKLRALIDRAIRERRRVVMPRPEADLLSPRPGQFEIGAVPIEDPTAEIRALLLVEDFEEVRSLERQLVRAEKLATVGILTAGLAHEIGTPLGIIRVRAETLLESLPPGGERNLASILGQIDSIATIIRQLLDFSRAEPIASGPTDVCAVARVVGDLLDFRLQPKRLALRIVTEQEPLLIAADADQLQQVLVNVVMNACDACPEGGHIAIRIARERGEGSFVRIEVEDDGCGIRAEHLHAVFDPFFTTKKQGEGTGLGLTVVANIVRNHGGHVSIASEPNRRTTVVIVWPTAQQEDRIS